MAKIIGGAAVTPMKIADWNQTKPNQSDFIKNKPEIVQTTGDSEKNLMSQKAVTKAIEKNQIINLESFDQENPLILSNLKSDIYTLRGTFLIYPNSADKIRYDTRTLALVKKDEMRSYVMTFDPVFSCGSRLFISGSSYENKTISLGKPMVTIRNNVLCFEEVLGLW